MNILALIGHGKENAITRDALVWRTGMTDRQVRGAIEQARHNGTIILNLQDSKGYYIPDDDEIDDVALQLKINERRAKAILHPNKFLRKKLKEAGRL